jgi:hypothetical protein
VRSALKLARVKSKEAASAVGVRRRIAQAKEERRAALEDVGILVCEMLDEGRLDEPTLRSRRATIAEISERISELERELDAVHEKATDELARDQS